MTRLFNALSGSELLDLLLLELREKLQDDPLFRNSVTYPVLRYRHAITLEAYPVDPPVLKTAISGALVDPGAGQPALTPVVSESESSGEVEYPDLVRTKLSGPKPAVAKRGRQNV
jgi:hypothetical protein